MFNSLFDLTNAQTRMDLISASVLLGRCDAHIQPLQLKSPFILQVIVSLFFTAEHERDSAERFAKMWGFKHDAHSS